MVRSDARENRDRLLAVARRAFKESGDVSMNQIARLANVGAGTLYRNFPNRDALVLAIYADEVAQLIDSVPSLLELPEAHGRFVASIADEIVAATPAAVRAEKAEAESVDRIKREVEAREEARVAADAAATSRDGRGSSA